MPVYICLICGLNANQFKKDDPSSWDCINYIMWKLNSIYKDCLYTVIRTLEILHMQNTEQYLLI